jgi:hypothetical protein
MFVVIPNVCCSVDRSLVFLLISWLPSVLGARHFPDLLVMQPLWPDWRECYC